MKSLGIPFKRKNFITLLQRYMTLKNDINHYLMMNACCRKTQSCIKYVERFIRRGICKWHNPIPHLIMNYNT